MSFSDAELTCDGFLDGKLEILQPKQGYRAATDPVYLAAAVQAAPGQKVLELGCGVGVALACLCYRVPDLQIYGLEIQADYVALARRNLEGNNFNGEIIEGDVLAMPANIKAINFDHIIANPPFFDEIGHTKPDDSGRRIAHIADPGATAEWVVAAVRRLKQGGVFTMIHRAEALTEVLVALSNISGDIRVLPIAARQGKPARRVIVQAQKSARGPLVLMPPLIVHNGDFHGAPHDGFSEIASGILRNGDPLVMS